MEESFYKIYREFLANDETYIDQLMDMVNAGLYITFIDGGFVVPFYEWKKSESNGFREPQLLEINSKEDIITLIEEKKKEAKTLVEPIEVQDVAKEGLHDFASRLTNMSKADGKYRRANYKGHDILVSPESTEFDILLQMIMIDNKIVQDQINEKGEYSDQEYIELKNARSGEEYMQYGERIYLALKNRPDLDYVMAHFNFAEVAFPRGVANLDGFISSRNGEQCVSDAFTYAQMLDGITYWTIKAREAISKTKTKGEGKGAPKL